MSVLRTMLLMVFIGSPIAIAKSASDANIFKDSDVVMLSKVVEVKDFREKQARHIVVPISKIDSRIVPVVVCIEDEKAGLFSPVAISDIDYANNKVTFVTAHGGRFVVVYIKSLFK